MAFDARDHLGVNVHSAAGAYSDIGLFTNFLTYLGVKWVRDDNPNGPALLPGYNVQFVNTATDSATAVTNTNTAIAGGAKAVELLDEPPTVPIMYGSSVQGVGGNLATHNTRFGHIPVWRYFSSGMPGALPAGNDVSQVGIYSMKCNGNDFTGMVAGTFDVAIRTWAGTLPAGQTIYACYYHEPENNWPSGASFAAGQVHFINLIRDIVAKGQTKANLKTITIFTAYILSFGKGSIPGGNSTRNITDWWPSVNPDMVGFDFDDNNAARSSFFDWVGIGYAGWAKTFADSKGIPWSVTECGAIRTTGDTSHAQYTIDMAGQAAGYAANGCSYVTYWDDSSSTLTTANEIAMWKNLVAQSAPMVAAQQTNRAIITAVNGRVPVIASALADGTSTKAALLWGPMKGVSQGNVHLYRGGADDPTWTTHRTAGYGLLPFTAKGLTFQVSETGYHDYAAASDDTDDATTATEIVPDFQQLVADGADKVFIYEAVDEDVAFPTSSAGFFGLAQDDWTPKPQAAAVQAYLASFATGPTAPLAPTSVIAMAGDTIADVTWTVGATGTLADTYIVTPTPLDVPAQTIIAPTLVAVFAGLTNGTSYTFTVKAHNAQGDSATVTSNSVTPLVAAAPPPIATGGGSLGSIAPIVKTPFPAAYPTPLADVTPNVAGQVQQCFLYDPSTADLLRITPNQAGIWLNDLDLGFPVIREVTASNPGRNGEYDQTAFMGARSISLSLTVMAAADASGTVQPPGYWLEVLRAWIADPSSRFRLGYQLIGQRQRFATVRPSDATAPMVGSGVGRSSISVQLTLRSPDGLLWEQNPLPNDLAVLQGGTLIGDGRFERIIPQAVAGSGITFPLTFPVTFPAQSTGVVTIPYQGTARSAPEIRIVGACTDPVVTALNPDGTARGQIAFTGLTLAGTDELRLDFSARTAVRLASGAISSNVRQAMTSWSWFDLMPGSTATNSYNRLMFQVGSGTATARVYWLNAFV
jgi:hypothetical protein